MKRKWWGRLRRRLKRRSKALLFLLCGLGNKGSEYAHTRHNLGYLAIDRFSEKYHISVNKKLCGCIVGMNNDVILAKPDTYMNLSGGPVSRLIREKGISLGDMLLIQDDLDMEFGKLKIKWNGRDAGHKGVRSVADALQSPLFFRMKIGIGRDPTMLPEEYVLSRFRKSELDDLTDALDRAAEAAHTFIFEGKEKAMSIYNKWHSDL
ncbi:MAG: aminoacyl-tRNA hydrolase [Syntrophobacterales bacterium]|nr:aminoacyl-tRNA hydrolase [Syntrophobacterales bacterium]